MLKSMESTAIWTYVYACFGAGGNMDLRLCMFERRRRYGLTLLHIAAPAVIWTYVYAYASAAGGGGGANVAVARVSCTLRSPRRAVQVLSPQLGVGCRAHFAQREL